MEYRLYIKIEAPNLDGAGKVAADILGYDGIDDVKLMGWKLDEALIGEPKIVVALNYNPDIEKRVYRLESTVAEVDGLSVENLNKAVDGMTNMRIRRIEDRLDSMLERQMRIIDMIDNINDGRISMGEA